MYEAVILAGGLGTRLRPVVADIPKPLAPIAGRPFLQIQLELLARQGVARAVLAVGHLGHLIRERLGDECGGVELVYSWEQEPLGTGGAMRQALEACRQDRVFVFNGDTYLEFDLAAAAGLAATTRRGVIVGRTVPDAARYGCLRIENGLVTGIGEKSIRGQGVVNAGCYLLARDQLAGFTAPRRFSFETEYLAATLPTTAFALCLTEGMFIDIGVPDDYARAQRLLADRCGRESDSLSP